MTQEHGHNLPASIAARLVNQARASGDDARALYSAFFCERFLYRLGVSPLRDRFVLKGALLLRVWTAHPYRATYDLDLLRTGDGAAEAIRSDIEAICAMPVPDDGVIFDTSSLRIETIRPEDEHVGARVSMLVRCGTSRDRFQIDIDVGDAAWPAPKTHAYPTLLDFPAPNVLVYARETVIAEKLEAIVVLGDRNSRIKDFFDIHHLAGHFAFDGATLRESIRRTFEQRATPIPEQEPIALTADYWARPERAPQIRAFARRAGIDIGPDPGRELLPLLRSFLLPLLDDLRLGASTAAAWSAGGPWR